MHIASLTQKISPFVFGSVTILKSPLDLINGNFEARRNSIRLDTADLRYQRERVVMEGKRAAIQADNLYGREVLVRMHAREGDSTVRTLASVGERMDSLDHKTRVLLEYSKRTSGVRRILGGIGIKDAFRDRDSLRDAMKPPRSEFRDFYERSLRNPSLK
ncbi:MAG: hypothetical protein M0026_17295 [Nocardiopsaceae bacterium]|nr:hypothetical protein [Nocardiopsaceae bacterium]